MALTSKQETFCIEVVKQDTLTQAHRIAYPNKMSDKSRNEAASRLMQDSKIIARVKELRKEVEKKELYTISQSVERDLNLIRTYESALIVLQSTESTEKEIQAAERTIKYIGASGYSSAQERLSKQHGFFDKDNKQKNDSKVTVFQLPDNGRENN